MEMNPHLVQNTFLDPSWFALPAAYPDAFALVTSAAHDSTPSYFTFDGESASVPCQEHRSDIAERCEDWPTPNAFGISQPGLGSPTYDDKRPSLGSKLGLFSASDGLNRPSLPEFGASSLSRSQAAPQSSEKMSGTSSRHISTSSTPIKRSQRQARDHQRERPQQLTRRSSSNTDLKAKAAHSVVERRYRDKLNDKMMQLHRALKVSDLITAASGDSAVLSDSSMSMSKVGKAEIMTHAIKYVDEAELQMRHMRDEIKRLQLRVSYLQSLVPVESHFFRGQMAAAF